MQHAVVFEIEGERRGYDVALGRQVDGCAWHSNGGIGRIEPVRYREAVVHVPA